MRLHPYLFVPFGCFVGRLGRWNVGIADRRGHMPEARHQLFAELVMCVALKLYSFGGLAAGFGCRSLRDASIRVWVYGSAVTCCTVDRRNFASKLKRNKN